METVYPTTGTGTAIEEKYHGDRLSLRGLIGGVLAALATQLLLMLLGAAIGLTAFEPSENVLKGVGIGFSVWLVISLSVSAFVGAWTTVALSHNADRRSGLLQGFVLWGALSCVGAWMIGGAVQSLMSGVAGVVGGAVSSAAQSPAAGQVTRDELKQQAGRAAAEARGKVNAPETAARVDRAAAGAAVGSWGLFVAMLLSLVSALFGGAAAAGSEEHVYLRSRKYVTRAVTEPGIPTTTPPAPTSPAPL